VQHSHYCGLVAAVECPVLVETVRFYSMFPSWLLMHCCQQLCWCVWEVFVVVEGEVLVGQDRWIVRQCVLGAGVVLPVRWDLETAVVAEHG